MPSARTTGGVSSVSLALRRGVRLLDDINLELHAGEIVGIAGVSGNGQTELLQVLSGIRPPSSGTLTVCGRRVDANHAGDPAEMRDLGVAHVPEDRLRQGMVAAFRASETASWAITSSRSSAGTSCCGSRRSAPIARS